VRYQHSSDLRADLKRLKRDLDSTGSHTVSRARPAARAPESKTRRIKWGLAAIVGVLLLAAIFYLMRPPAPAKVLAYRRIAGNVAGSGILLSDGNRLYFPSFSPSGEVALGQVSTSGGETVWTQPPFPDLQVGDISPSGSELLIARFSQTQSEGPLWIIPIPAGTPRRLGMLVGHDGTWTPDGRQITYASGNDLYTASTDGSGSRKLASLPGSPASLRWSPDGRRLRFTVQDLKRNFGAIWELGSGAAAPHPLLAGWHDSPDECCGNWTPDGKYYLFVSSVASSPGLWALRTSRGWFRRGPVRPERLTTGPTNFIAPVLGRDNKLFAIGMQTRGELVRYDAPSGRFFPYLSGLSAEGVTFSRDGAWVAYVASPDNTLWRSKTDGTERLQLSSAPMTAALPRWSPDGKQIAFIGTTPGKSWQVYVVSVDGGGTQPVTPPDANQFDPDWSADGNSLVIGSRGAEGAAARIQILDLKTRKTQVLPGSEGLFSPRWSQDGRYIVAMPTRQDRLVIYDFTAKRWTDLALVPAAYPNWSHDGKYVYFMSNFVISNRDIAFFRVRISDRLLERVAAVTNVGRMAIGLLGPWSGLSPDDSPLLLRDISSQDVYALDWDAP
jgi:Tol biopolymer transport system component